MMRFLKILLSGVCLAGVVCRPAAGQPGVVDSNALVKRRGMGGWVNAGVADNVAATWHFAGSARLADNPSFANVKTMLTLQSSVEFRNLALDRVSDWLAPALGFGTNRETPGLLRPLLDDLLTDESYWGLGGTNQGPLNFILAVKLSEKRAQAWQDNLGKALSAPVEMSRLIIPGRRWKTAGGRTLWIIRSQDWTLVGNGDDLPSLESQFVMFIDQQSRPGPELKENWLEADLNWPRLIHWLPDSAIPFKPARTKISLTVETNQLLALNATIHYAEAIPWKSDPWRVPYDLIRSPLLSFTTGQDIAAYLTPGEPLARLADNPLTGQFYVWALPQMGLQSYAAWPVADAAGTLQRIASQALGAFNPDLARLKAGELVWRADRHLLQWARLGPMVSPELQVAPETNGQFLLAGFFPFNASERPGPPALYQQFVGRTNLVYYDWEGTGARLDQWRLLAGILPLFQKPPMDSDDGGPANQPASDKTTKPPLFIEESWLAGLKPMLMKNTVTEITRVAPDELALVRKAPLGVTALELVVFSHWLSGAGSTGLLPGLLPPPANVSGPGRPPAP